MKVNSVSSGKTSSFMAVHHPADIDIFACVCIDFPKAAPKDSAVLNYCLHKLNGNFIASAEHEKSLKIMMQLEQLLGKEIVWVRGKSFDEVIDNAGCLPTWKRRFCTTELKIIPIFEYLYFRHGITEMNIGYRWDDIERIAKIQTSIEYPLSKNNFGAKQNNWSVIEWRKCFFPLKTTFHSDIIHFWKTQHPDFDFPLDSNCRGCHHKPAELINQNNKETPEILEWFSLQEKKKKGLGRKINTWHDDKIPYEQKFNMNFTERINFDFTMCNSGGCTD